MFFVSSGSCHLSCIELVETSVISMLYGAGRSGEVERRKRYKMSSKDSCSPEKLDTVYKISKKVIGINSWGVKTAFFVVEISLSIFSTYYLYVRVLKRGLLLPHLDLSARNAGSNGRGSFFGFCFAYLLNFWGGCVLGSFDTVEIYFSSQINLSWSILNWESPTWCSSILGFNLRQHNGRDFEEGTYKKTFWVIRLQMSSVILFRRFSVLCTSESKKE